MQNSLIILILILDCFLNCTEISTSILQLSNGQSTDMPIFQHQKETNIESDPCTSGQKCSTNVDKVLPNCYCDLQCKEFNDCCLDYNDTTITSQPSLVQLKPFLVCNQDLIQYDWTNGRGIYVVAACPKHFKNKTISQECVSADNSSLPVSDGYIVYANEYCAYCHGVKSFKMWTVSVEAFKKKCYNYVVDSLKWYNNYNMTVLDDLRKNLCQISLVPQPRDGALRTCRSNLDDFTEHDKSCKSYFNPLKVTFNNYTKKIFYNYNCIGGKDQILKYDCLSKVDYIDTFDKNILIYPLTVIFNMNNKYSTEKQQEITGEDISSTCPENDMDCKENNIHCLKPTTQVKNYRFFFSAVFLSNHSIDNEVITRVLSLFFSCLPLDKYSLKIYKAHIYLHNVNSTSPDDGKQVVKSMLNTTWYALVNTPLSIPNVLGIQEKINRMEMSYTEKRPVNINDTIWVWKENDYELADNEKYEGNGTKLKFNLKIAERTLSTFNMKNDLNKPDCVPKYCQIQSSVFTDKTKRKLTYTLNEHRIIYSERKLTTRIITTTEAPLSDIYTLQTILTYVTLSISAFSVFITFFIFLKINLGKSSVGLITMNMLGVIFLFNVFFMVGASFKDFYSVCYLSGVVTHYLALLYFIWVTIFVVYAVFTINRTKQLQSRRLSITNSNNFKLILFFGYTSPSFVVVPAVIFDSFPLLSIQIGYGKGICFPAYFPGSLFVFTIPVGICIFINILCLLFSVISFWKLNNAVVNSNLQTSKTFVIIFLRVVSVSAISWILGFLTGLTDNPIIGLCFIVLSGLHGFIICLCLFSTNVFLDAWKKFRDHIAETENNIELFEIDPDINCTNVETGTNITDLDD